MIGWLLKRIDHHFSMPCICDTCKNLVRIERDGRSVYKCARILVPDLAFTDKPAREVDHPGIGRNHCRYFS